MESADPFGLIVVGAVAVAVVAGGLLALLRMAARADAADVLTEAFREQGFELVEKDAVAWLRSQMPALQLPASIPVVRRGRHRAEVSVDPKLCRREDRDVRLAVFELPDAIGRTHDRLVFAVDPRDRAFVSEPPDAAVSATHAQGWSHEIQGAWILVYRREPTPTSAEDVPRLVDQALAIARRLLQRTPGGVR
jgi:hypothetical protein